MLGRKKLQSRSGDIIPDPEGDGEVTLLAVTNDSITYRHPYRGQETQRYQDLTITEWNRIKEW
jgi:hypothetical protein